MLKSFLKRATTVLVAGMSAVFLLISAMGEETGFPVLTNLIQLRELPQVEARKGYPVQFRGVVTCFDPVYSAIYLQDGHEAVYVRYPIVEARVRPGDEVVVKGFSIAGDHNFIAAA